MSNNIFVIVTGCSIANYWYAGKIGQVFEVTDTYGLHDRYDEHSDILRRVILKRDSRVLTDAETLQYKLDKANSDLAEKVKVVRELETQLKELNTIKEYDIVAGAVFKTTCQTITLIRNWDFTFLLSGNEGDHFKLFSDNPKTREDMVRYLNSNNAKKVVK